MAYENIVVETRGKVGVISLSAGKLNPLSKQLLRELMDAMKTFEADDNILCIVIFGNDEVFCAGANIKEFASENFVDMFSQNRFGEETEAFRNCRKPIIAGVNGYALGGGCELAMNCDMILAAESAQFGQPEILLGLMPGLGGTQRLTRAIGKAKSMEMHLTGRRMSAREADQAGLVSKVVPDADLKEETMAVANKITEQAPLAVMAIKEAINQSEELPLREGLLLERRLFHALFATEDKNEGVQAFIEKRKANFTGK